MKKIITSVLFLSPVLAFAQILTTIGTIQSIIDAVIPLLMTLAVVAFFWGLVKYIANADDEAAKESGKTLMIWGMVAIFVMVAFWGIIGFFQESFGVTGAIDQGTPATTAGILPT